eukprot:12919419-Prorocentrum_lima.AAC.1
MRADSSKTRATELHEVRSTPKAELRWLEGALAAELLEVALASANGGASDCVGSETPSRQGYRGA